MLIRYKKSFEKIAMGLLSFMPEVSDLKMLQGIIKEYETNENWNLFLWRDEDILGTIGIRVEGRKVIIQHVSVNPSHRNSGIGRQMIQRIQENFGSQYEICADEATESFVVKCESQRPSSQV
ncbi:riboflavin biosynthesis RibT protein [Halobacillus alkaliphilus]|uniref:Riboflavin biosynthesis RibT protein n=1 Tax=Halobacillus alkaliphilus TaxID=396056 RepID=A0A1I2K6R3_9BACI|nr:GNAT family N-acetyltransferase [Halobacillus alkaliphilus]SFF62604.1 riboflavin biosynthesis RibT protein [Halobacillus alkaliphilus]